MMQLRNITLYRDGNKICENISVDVAKGEALIITGKNASGKTSLLQCLMGQMSPQKGEVLIDGHDLHALHKADKKLFLDSTGIVLHELSLRPLDTVCATLAHSSQRDLLSFLGLDPSSQRMIQDLSHSEKKILDLARSLVKLPRLVIWDEPLCGLDSETADKFLQALLKLKKEGSTIIIATVNPNQFDILTPEKMVSF